MLDMASLEETKHKSKGNAQTWAERTECMEISL